MIRIFNKTAHIDNKVWARWANPSKAFCPQANVEKIYGNAPYVAHILHCGHHNRPLQGRRLDFNKFHFSLGIELLHDHKKNRQSPSASGQSLLLWQGKNSHSLANLSHEEKLIIVQHVINKYDSELVLKDKL